MKPLCFFYALFYNERNEAKIFFKIYLRIFLSGMHYSGYRNKNKGEVTGWRKRQCWS